jgi:hypothetical protein
MVQVHARWRWVMGCHHVSNRKQQQLIPLWRFFPAPKPPLVPNLTVGASVELKRQGDLYFEQEEKE